MISTLYRAWVMRIGEHHIAVGPQELKEVIEAEHITPLPLSPAPMLGLLSSRGTVVPLIDYGIFNNQGHQGPFQGAVVQVGDNTMAIAIHEIVGIVPWDPEPTTADHRGLYTLERAYHNGKAVDRLDLKAIVGALQTLIQNNALVTK